MNTIEHQKADHFTTTFKVKSQSIDFILNYSKALRYRKTNLGMYQQFQN
tara:strand:- start:16016 stop:16162 length:147 start_codon:yes stop_codon:yes gene_type:complete